MTLVGLGFYFFATSAFASISMDAAFFKLHQATGFFEQYVAGHCPLGKESAVNALTSLENQRLNDEIMNKIGELRTKISGKMVPKVTDLESFRLSIHQMQERLKLRHEQRWHDEIVKECRTHTSMNGKMSIPKFECTAIEMLEPAKARRILGSNSYPSASLRMSSPDRWIFTKDGEQMQLGKDGVIETFDPIARKSSYRIQAQSLLLNFELVGTPPSRQGFLWEVKMPPEKSIKLARITCH